jgi:uncharacterized membrane protein YkvA (DUF1232 family)
MMQQLVDNARLAFHLMRDNRVSTVTKVIPFAILAYILSPIDLIPDFLLPFGIGDDIGALVLGLQLFIRSVPPSIVEEYRQGKRASKPQDVMEGEYRVRES